MKILLVKNGVYPITTDKNGKPLNTDLDTGYSFPGTLQGEGKLVGIPVLFIRTAGCNLRCSWQLKSGEVNICDTPYSSHRVEEVEEWEVEDIVETVRQNLGQMHHIVISGGEPTTQGLPLRELVRQLKKKLRVHITVETNGTLYVPELAQWIDLFSFSPKLESSEPSGKKNRQLEYPVEDDFIRDHKRLRRNLQVIQKYINECMNLANYYDDNPAHTPERRTDKDFQLKFVIAREEEEEEIKRDFLSHLSFVRPEDVVLMALGSTRNFLDKTTHMTASMAIRNSWRFTPRVHIDLFNDARNV